MVGSYDEEEDYEISVPPVPPAFGTLTAAQQALAELLQVPQELLVAAAQHSKATMSSNEDDFVAWIELLPQDRRNDYLVRLAHNEPGLSRLLVKEMRELAEQFKEVPTFQMRFRTWVRPHMRRPALLKRLHDRKFTLPDA